MQKYDWHKAGGVLIKDRKLLAGRNKDKIHFLTPGGAIEAGETPKQALIRELIEEVQITVTEDDLEELGIFYAPAAGNEGSILRMDVFMVKNWEDQEAKPDSEVEELVWLSSNVPENITVGSILEHHIIPQLKSADLID